MILTKENLESYDVSAAVVSYKNLSSSTLTLTRQVVGDGAFSYKQDVSLVLDGELVFSGKVSDVKQAISGAALIETVTVLSAVGWMDRVIYSETRLEPKYGYTVNIGETTTETGALLPLDKLLRVPFEYGAQAVGLALDAQTGLTCLDYLPSGQESCVNIMVSLSRYHPSVYAWEDFAGGGQWRWRKVEDLPVETLPDGVGVISYEMRPRYDLQPPCVALTGGVQYSVGGSPADIDAYVYHVPESVLSNSAYAGIQQSAQAANRQRSVVLGVRLPQRRERGLTASLADVVYPMADEVGVTDFWSRFPSMTGIRAYESYSTCSPFYVEYMSAEEAFPQDGSVPPDERDPDEAVPYNYQVPDDNPNAWVTTAVLLSGSFPASAEARQCVFGLRWCRAKIKQYVAITSEVPADVDKLNLLSIYNSKGQVAVDGVATEVRLAVLTADVVLINRLKKKYYPIDNGLAEGDPDYDDYSPEVEEYPEFPTEEQLRVYADEYYSETRELRYDGSVVLAGYSGNPSVYMGSRFIMEGMDNPSPVQGVDYDVFNEVLTITVGSTDVLGLDERVARYQSTRAAELEALASNDNPQTRQAGLPLDTAAQEALSPFTVTASVAARSEPYSLPTQDIMPFTVYQDGDRVMLKGGVDSTPTGIITMPDLDITDLWQSGQIWTVETVLSPSTAKYEFYVYYTSTAAANP